MKGHLRYAAKAGARHRHNKQHGSPAPQAPEGKSVQDRVNRARRHHKKMRLLFFALQEDPWECFLPGLPFFLRGNHP